MPVIKCEMCGSRSLSKMGYYIICDYCKTKYSLEDSRKPLETETGKPSGASSNLFNNARRAYQNRDYELAKRYYTSILNEEPNNWEAFFYRELCYVRISLDPVAISHMEIAITSAFEMICVHLDYNSQENAIKEMFDELSELILNGIERAVNTYNYNIKSMGSNKKSIGYGFLPGDLDITDIHSNNEALERKADNYLSLYDCFIIHLSTVYDELPYSIDESLHDFKKQLTRIKESSDVWFQRKLNAWL